MSSGGLDNVIKDYANGNPGGQGNAWFQSRVDVDEAQSGSV